MAFTVKDIVEAFELLFSSLHRKEFTKTLQLNKWGEQDLLPLVRTYLLGYFGIGRHGVTSCIVNKKGGMVSHLEAWCHILYSE